MRVPLQGQYQGALLLATNTIVASAIHTYPRKDLERHGALTTLYESDTCHTLVVGILASHLGGIITMEEIDNSPFSIFTATNEFLESDNTKRSG